MVEGGSSEIRTSLFGLSEVGSISTQCTMNVGSGSVSHSIEGR